jgi:demethoxyubiquinone hydroxylase (CLK1/Coq7/Cat5 family)
MTRILEISDTELRLLNFYRVSELNGGLLLGHLLRGVRDPELIRQLTQHSAEEVVHSQLWLETIFDVGGRPSPMNDSYQARYAAAMRPPSTIVEVLALTQVFERRVFRHFTEHLRRPATHPRIKVTLRRMLDEERGHLSWVKRWLDAAAGRGMSVKTLMHRYSMIDATVYDTLARDYGWRVAA